MNKSDQFWTGVLMFLILGMPLIVIITLFQACTSKPDMPYHEQIIHDSIKEHERMKVKPQIVK